MAVDVPAALSHVGLGLQFGMEWIAVVLSIFSSCQGLVQILASTQHVEPCYHSNDQRGLNKDSVLLPTPCSLTVNLLLVPLLSASRLPALSNLTIEVTLGQQSVALAVVLSSISSRLPRLRDLTLVCADSWEECAQRVWEQLGGITQVTCLQVLFEADGRGNSGSERRGCMLPHLAPLGNLTGLQQLSINSCKQPQQGGEGQGQQGMGFEFLGELAALTHLDIAVASIHGFTSISSCTALQVLRLRPVRSSGDGGRLSDVDWDALGHLSSLTQLRITPFHQPQLSHNQQHFCAALRQLTRLESVGLCAWLPATLPVLASLPRLRCMGGYWVHGPPAAVPGVVCEHVMRLEHAMLSNDGADFRAFPNLEVYRPLSGAMSAEAWQCMTASCPKLRDMGGAVDSTTGLLDFTRTQSWRASFGSSVGSPARLLALRSLSQLTALTRLSFKADEPLEAAALADAVPRVREMHFVALAGLAQNCMCLTPLAKLAEQSLERLYVYFAEGPLFAQDAQVLLCALSRVPKVVVAGLPGVAEVLESAVQNARAVGLLLPADMRVVSLCRM